MYRDSDFAGRDAPRLRILLVEDEAKLRPYLPSSPGA
jgi:hypothetical protein